LFCVSSSLRDGLSMFQSSDTGYVCLIVCDHETSKCYGMGMIWAVA